mmetsp:Transcript_19248/g.76633  ORF Transcript_19248/g.76633 Transcript_19248/m.76633 type:complete len:203 (+) Transcript_19248:3-611(+)
MLARFKNHDEEAEQRPEHHVDRQHGARRRRVREERRGARLARAPREQPQRRRPVRARLRVGQVAAQCLVQLRARRGRDGLRRGSPRARRRAGVFLVQPGLLDRVRDVFGHGRALESQRVRPRRRRTDAPGRVSDDEPRRAGAVGQRHVPVQPVARARPRARLRRVRHGGGHRGRRSGTRRGDLRRDAARRAGRPRLAGTVLF